MVDNQPGGTVALAQPHPQVPPVIADPGTFRTVSATQTRQRVEPMLPLFGITRVADITRLDEIGVPVHVAYRPCGKTLAVSIGIGLDPEQSWVSAAMESIETWHAENDRLEIVARGPARSVAPGYDVCALNLAERSPLTDRTVLDWVAATGLLSGKPYLVPVESVRLDSTRRLAWEHILFQVTSNGLATGNSRGEATLHGLLEIIERDCCTPYTVTPLAQRRYVDPAGTDDPGVAAVLAALRRVDCWVEVCETTNAIGIPCYACSIWSADLPIVFGGFGCHLDAGRAIFRALMEAVQSRLATVSGARDDIDREHYESADPAVGPATRDRQLLPVLERIGPVGGIDAMVRLCAENVMALTGVEPFVVDLTRPDIGIPASKVIAPGLALYHERDLSRRPGEHHV
jgi:YcaO-like protein with predicted kinase domain